MSRLKFGVVTHVGGVLSTLVSGSNRYDFATSSFPSVELGLEVTFFEDMGASTPNTKYARGISGLEVKNYVVKDLLERIAKLEEKVLEGNKFTTKTEDRDYSKIG